jgi:2-amino-4-hydroxy-6-hydroxymethyldihydropteridine diphosphokinase
VTDDLARRAYLGLGSNMGDRLRYLRDAVATLAEVGPTRVSPVYETAPVGGPDDQGPYLNLAVELRTDRSPRDLLGVCHRLEAAAGRVRDVRWGPRTLDVDVLWVEGMTVDEPDLEVPHPRMWERRFVMAPLHDLAPDLFDQIALDASEGFVQPVGDLDTLQGT